jgi:5-methylcytosine-specific restriction endonuclease McrA
MNLETLSNEELLSGLRALSGESHRVLARLLAYLGEVEQRRLDLESACSSLFDFCVRRLGMSEDEACRRVRAARIVRKFPIALSMIERGEIHLTALLLLRDHLTEDGHEELLGAAAHKTKSEVEHLIAQRFPRPDAPLVVEPLQPLPLTPRSPHTAVSAGPPPTSELRAPRIEPLSPERYRVQFTASAELKRKIERATNLMRHTNPPGDLSVLMERALDLLIARLEKQRLGKAARPRQAPRKCTRRGYIPRAVRREVFERDGEQCTFSDPDGRRCESRTLLELDHVTARAHGGTDDSDNLTVRCRKHNALSAERDFGRDYVQRRKTESRSKNHPRHRGYESHPGQCEHEGQGQREQEDATAFRALRSMGFKDGEARHALEMVTRRLPRGPAPPIEILLRHALSVLA